MKLKRFKNIGENISEDYKMDLDAGDMGDEHAKAVLDRAFEMHRQAGAGNSWNLQAAFDAVVKENQLDDKSRKSMVADSVRLILEELTEQAEELVSITGFRGSQIPFNSFKK